MFTVPVIDVKFDPLDALLYALGLRLAHLTKHGTDETYNNLIKDKEVAIQFLSDDVARYYRFVDGHFGQAIGKAKTSDLTIEFKDSMTGVKILTKGDIATFMSAIQDGDITITGDYKLLLWLASIAKHAAKLPEEYKGYLNQAKPYLERELKEGHGIAIHSFSHDYNKLYPKRVPNPATIKEEAEKTMLRLKELLGDKFNTRVWRYPGGHMSWKGLENAGNGDETLKSLGLEWIDWNSLSGDAEPLKVRPTNKEEMLKYVKTSLSYWKQQNVAVVLMHDSQGKNLTLETLPSIIDYFKSNGYEFGILK